MTAHDSFCAQDVPVVGFMSGGMVIDTVSEGFCNYLKRITKRLHACYVMALNYVTINNRINIFLQSLRSNARRIALHIRKATHFKIF